MVLGSMGAENYGVEIAEFFELYGIPSELKDFVNSYSWHKNQSCMHACMLAPTTASIVHTCDPWSSHLSHHHRNRWGHFHQYESPAGHHTWYIRYTRDHIAWSRYCMYTFCFQKCNPPPRSGLDTGPAREGCISVDTASPNSSGYSPDRWRPFFCPVTWTSPVTFEIVFLTNLSGDRVLQAHAMVVINIYAKGCASATCVLSKPPSP